ncbi:MAG TPA: DsbA family protein [Anaerolineales bacterium]|nr:DsbA family protein [Anaerolineales bacterium]
MSAPLTIHIFFDYTCPWCYVTELLLERLAREYPLALIPKAFPLWPNGTAHLTPEENEALRVRTHAADAHAITAAREWLGVEGMSLGAWGVNTLEAHIGAKFAAARGKLWDYQRAMFAAQFHRDLRLDSRETLSLLAAEAGLSSAEFLSALEAEEYRRAALTDLAQAMQLGITGVPALVIGNRYLIVGARPPEALREIIEKANQVRGPA